VKTSVIKQWAGLCRPNGFRTICPNAKDYVRRDPVFSAFRYVMSWGSTGGARRRTSTSDLGYSGDRFLAQNVEIPWFSRNAKTTERERRKRPRVFAKSLNSGKLGW
jgi:hypothetical protein